MKYFVSSGRVRSLIAPVILAVQLTLSCAVVVGLWIQKQAIESRLASSVLTVSGSSEESKRLTETFGKYIRIALEPGVSSSTLKTPTGNYEGFQSVSGVLSQDLGGISAMLSGTRAGLLVFILALVAFAKRGQLRLPAVGFCMAGAISSLALGFGCVGCSSGPALGFSGVLSAAAPLVGLVCFVVAGVLLSRPIVGPTLLGVMALLVGVGFPAVQSVLLLSHPKFCVWCLLMVASSQMLAQGLIGSGPGVPEVIRLPRFWRLSLSGMALAAVAGGTLTTLGFIQPTKQDRGRDTLVGRRIAEYVSGGLGEGSYMLSSPTCPPCTVARAFFANHEKQLVTLPVCGQGDLEPCFRPGTLVVGTPTFFTVNRGGVVTWEYAGWPTSQGEQTDLMNAITPMEEK